MGRPCSACVSPLSAQINMQIATGATSKAIAASTGVSPSAISRHRRVCLQPAVLTDAEQLRLLVDRSEELWTVAATHGDVRAMAQSLASSLRALEFRFRHSAEQEAQAQSARDLPPDTKLWTEAEAAKFRAYLDHIVSTTRLPSAEQYATYCEGEHREHSDLLPLRLT